MTLAIAQVASQRTWPRVGDIDDCWVLAWMMAQIACAPWLPWLDAATARKYAGDPDDGVSDGNARGVDDMMTGIRAATPALAPLVGPIRGSWTFGELLPRVKAGRIFAAAVMGSALPQVYTTVPHQVVLFHEPGVGLRLADPMAPDRSEPYRIGTAAAERALYSYAGPGKVYGVLFPSPAEAIRTHPLWPKDAGLTDDELAAAVLAAVGPLLDRIERIRAIAAE
jgi:hypothetical protein